MPSSVGGQIDFERRVEQARANVKAMDQVDGFAERHPRTILLALEAGLKNPSTNAQFDAYVMLADLCDMVSEKEGRG